MKKVLVIFIVGVVLAGACSAQNTNIAQKIVGTWVDEENEFTFIFNSNGTLTQIFDEEEKIEGKYAIAGTKLVVNMGERDPDIILNGDGTGEISLSSDGKTLIITSSDGRDKYWLTKK